MDVKEKRLAPNQPTKTKTSATSDEARRTGGADTGNPAIVKLARGRVSGGGVDGHTVSGRAEEISKMHDKFSVSSGIPSPTSSPPKKAIYFGLSKVDNSPATGVIRLAAQDSKEIRGVSFRHSGSSSGGGGDRSSGRSLVRDSVKKKKCFDEKNSALQISSEHRVKNEDSQAHVTTAAGGLLAGSPGGIDGRPNTFSEIFGGEEAMPKGVNGARSSPVTSGTSILMPQGPATHDHPADSAIGSKSVQNTRGSGKKGENYATRRSRGDRPSTSRADGPPCLLKRHSHESVKNKSVKKTSGSSTKAKNSDLSTPDYRRRSPSNSPPILRRLQHDYKSSRSGVIGKVSPTSGNKSESSSANESPNGGVRPST